MLKLILLTLFALAAATSDADSGYTYHSSEPQVTVTTTHHAQPAPQQHQQTHHTSHDDGYEKQFYYFNAPVEHVQHQQQVVKKITPQKVKKNLQVIFIKPPEEKHHRPRPVQTVHHNNVVEEQTHIYVLSKEPEHHVAKKVQQIAPVVHHHQHKPEVHHLTYHTPAEAQKLQETIIQQYGGKPSDVVHINGGNAPAVNFISSSHKIASPPSVNRQYLAPPVTTNVAAPGSSYIPPV